MLRNAMMATLRARSKNICGWNRLKSTSRLEGDSGNFATHVHHGMSTALVVAAPFVFLSPDSMTDGMIEKVFGIGISTIISAHSWVGLNYIVTDYVPKVSKALVGPARVASAAIAGVTFIGLGKISLNNEGGIKGALKGLWNPKKETN